LWFAAGLVVVVSAFAVAVLVQVRDDLYEALDNELEGDLALAERWLRAPAAAPPRALAHEPSAESASPGKREDDLPWVEAWSIEGRLLLASGPRHELPIPSGPPATWHRGAASLRVHHERAVRTYVRLAYDRGQPVILRVGRSEHRVRIELREFATAFLVSLPLAFVVAAAAGYWLARRALSPVAEMTARARHITADHLAERLPVDNPDTEFGQLATVINGALARLEQSFDTLRRFTADASHELRTPLTAIRSVGEVGLRDRRTEAEYREIVGSVLEEADRLTTLIDSLLLLSRADAGKVLLDRSPIGLCALAVEVVSDLEVLAEEKRQRLFAGGERAVTVMGDRTTLRQAVINLVDNAIKYAPEGSIVELCAGRVDGDAVLEVLDAGPGIAAEHLPHLFERFYRVDEARSRTEGGAGLGLAIARWAVEANGGRIEVQSIPGRGSLFSVVLPIA
jgi:heavy metal sensor kinase